MEQQQTTIESINGLAEIADYMQDEELTAALTFIAKIIIKPDIPAQVAISFAWKSLQWNYMVIFGNSIGLVL